MSKIKIASHPEFLKINNIKHGFFGRNGGVSAGGFSSLNIKEYDCDDPIKNVNKNIQIVLKSLDIADSKFLNPKQIHSNKVVTITDLQQCWQVNNKRPEADAIVTNIKGIVLGIATADCTPILFVDSENVIVGAVHAGWRGAKGGIIENTIKAMQNLGAEIPNIKAIIGPCIHQKSYEVSQDFYDDMLLSNNYNNIFFTASKEHNKHFMFDLPSYVKHRLNGEVFDVNIDTYSNNGEFFSYRRSVHRGDKDSGRQISVISLFY